MSDGQEASGEALRLVMVGGGDREDVRGRMETGLLLRWRETSLRLLVALSRARGGGGSPMSPEQVRRSLGFSDVSDPRTPGGFGSRTAYYHPEVIEDLVDWAKERPAGAWQVVFLCEMSRRDPFVGEGAPARLSGVLEGTWSRRLAGPHRLVYRVTDERVDLLIARVRFPPPEEPAAGEASPARPGGTS